jgi:hypothetical protein
MNNVNVNVNTDPNYILHNDDAFLWYKYNEIAVCFIYKCVLHKGMYTVLHMIRKVL